MTKNEENNQSNIIPTGSGNLAQFNSSLASRGLDLANLLAHKKKASELVKSDLQEFEYETVKVNRRGEIIKRDIKQASYFTQDLGNGVTLDMVKVPLGTFLMGTDDEEVERLNQKYNTNWYRREKPQHQVTIPPFFMAKYPITQAQWKAIAEREKLKIERDLKTEPSRFKGTDLPVERVSWLDAVEFCSRLSKLTNQEYQLPSEAQWEYACRASSPLIKGDKWGLTTPFYCGETITTDLANYYWNNTYADEPEGIYRQQTTPVGQFPPNPFGLYDMHGNVWEWCADKWHYHYKNAPSDERPFLNGSSKNFVMRGGSWGSSPNYCRCANRIYEIVRNVFSHNIGFRVMLSVKKDR